MSESVAYQKALGKLILEAAIPLMPPKTVQMLNPISRKLIDCKDTGVADVWSAVFLSCLKYMPIEAIIEQVFMELI
jgi:hypothetical protein